MLCFLIFKSMWEINSIGKKILIKLAKQKVFGFDMQSKCLYVT